jgi:hypothetical protein
VPTSVVAAVAASVVAEYATAYVLVTGMATGFAATAIGYAAGFVVSSGIQSALGGGAEDSATTSPGFTAAAEQRMHVIRSTTANRQIIYGQAMVSGPLVFAAGSSDNNTLHLVVALAGHEVEEIGDIYFNDVLASDAKFSGLVTISKHLGTTDQVADADLVAASVGWTADHRLRGTAYIYLKLTYDRDAFPRGIPNIKAVVKGKKLYDPRTGLTAYNTNWALAVRDYLASSYGLGCTSAEIDDTAIIAAANIADEAIALAAGGTEARYTANGVLDMGATPRSAMDGLLTAGAGVMVWTAGKYTLHPGAYVSPDVTLDADDLRGAVKVRAKVTRQELYNGVKGTYVDPAKYWQPGDFPPVTNSTYATADGGQIFRDIALPYTTSSATAQRLARLMLEKSRQGITVEMPCKLTAFKVSLWSTVRVTLAQLGWSAKEFKVTGWTFDPAGGVNLALQEEAAACYAWSADETIIDAAPDTGLPDPFTVAPPGVPAISESLYETTGSAGVKAKASISVAAPDDAFVEFYQYEWRTTGSTAWSVLGRSTSTALDVFDVAPGRYDVRVKAINGLGVSSTYAQRDAVEIRGLAAPPATLTGLGLQAAGGLAILTWSLHPDLDVRIGGRIRVRHSPEMAGATWETSTSIGEAVAGNTTVAVLPLKEGTYLARPEDSSGILATSATTISTKQATALAWSSLGSVQEDDDYTGTHTGTFVAGGLLQLGSAINIDAVADLDALASIDAMGGVTSAGTYDFATGLDLGTVQHVRLTTTIAAQALNVLDMIDSRSGSIDAWADFDGTLGAPVDAWVEVRDTDDNPAGTPTWSAWRRLDAAEYQARAFDFRAQLTSADPSYTIQISQLRVAAAGIA